MKDMFALEVKALPRRVEHLTGLLMITLYRVHAQQAITAHMARLILVNVLQALIKMKQVNQRANHATKVTTVMKLGFLHQQVHVILASIVLLVPFTLSPMISNLVVFALLVITACLVWNSLAKMDTILQ